MFNPHWPHQIPFCHFMFLFASIDNMNEHRFPLFNNGFFFFSSCTSLSKLCAEQQDGLNWELFRSC